MLHKELEEEASEFGSGAMSYEEKRASSLGDPAKTLRGPLSRISETKYLDLMKPAALN